MNEPNNISHSFTANRILFGTPSAEYQRLFGEKSNERNIIRQKDCLTKYHSNSRYQ